MASAHLPDVTPRHLQPIAQAIQQVCASYLDADYQRLGLLMLHDLSEIDGLRLNGKPEGWAGGVLWVLFEHNFFHGAPDSIAAMLAEVLGVSEATLRKRRHEISAQLSLDNPSDAMAYLHPAVFDMLYEVGQDMPLVEPSGDTQHQVVHLALPEDLAPEAQQALMQAFQAKLDDLMQGGGVDMAQMTAIAKTFGITVVTDDPFAAVEDDAPTPRPS
ncbi:MAG: hypothetical protein RL180_1034 [Pseudomonadota bacterium]|jgi:hypothetical protein